MILTNLQDAQVKVKQTSNKGEILKRKHKKVNTPGL